jgi:NAD(P)-dependent dehydrogenase (short-subunit alcohol dehydrogenase family)
MTVLRGDLLQGRAVALARGVPDDVAGALAQLGARVELLGGQQEIPEERVGEWGRAHGPLDALVYDAAPSFVAGGHDGLLNTMQNAWEAIREVALGALIDSPRPAKIILLGPALGAGSHAGAAAAALENLARTLSVEWARHGITSVMVARGEQAAESALAELVCFLASVGGEYLSGCRLDVVSPG